MVMGLLIDKNGLPIGYELFSGKTFDSKTMVKVLDNLKSKFNLDKVVIVHFIAFMLERDLEIRLKKSKSFKKYVITPDRIKEALNSLELSKIKVDNKILYMKSNHSNGQEKLKFAKSIMKFLHIKQLKNISTKENLLCLA